MKIRDMVPGDIPRIQEIHEATQIDYRFPDLQSPLFLVTKVLEDDSGTVRACGGLYLQVECYLWMDPGEWTSPRDKLSAISALDGCTLHAGWLRGLDCAVLWLPPGMDRFGERLVRELGFHKDRDGWVSFSKEIK